ncbi:MAG: hypothetical protein CYPHOPRED_005777 [Cyphobasidiales sp. Tagirdzhanova-0007]|nr:MAG: hypothetical protein CYPHOPRED_005777 [Cyphobasidiales sp. Tagirdzhanova-0007]
MFVLPQLVWAKLKMRTDGEGEHGRDEDSAPEDYGPSCTGPARPVPPFSNERTPLLVPSTVKQGRRQPLVTSIMAVVFSAMLILWVMLSHSSSVLLHLLSSLGSLSTCSTCFSLLVPVRQLALLGDNAFTKTFTDICIDLHIQPAHVCKGALQRQAPIIAQSIRQIQPNKRTAAALCTKLFGLCSARGEAVMDWPSEVFPTANISKKARQRSGKSKKVVHITDLHIDRLYQPGSEAACGESLCCRAGSTALSSTTRPHWKAGPFGNPHCDTPFSLFRSMLDEISKVARDAAFVISTGDVPSHAVWEDTQETTSSDILEAFAIMRSVLKVPIYGALGNHDIAPVNLYPRSTNVKAFRASQWVYDLHFSAWRDWIGPRVNRTAFVEAVGCYSARINDMNLKIISLYAGVCEINHTLADTLIRNTNYWSGDNFYLFDTDFPPSDPEGILGFLMQELQAAESQGEHAIILGHASPALAFPAQSHYFDQIVQRYRSTVVGQFYGHTHSSDFIVSYSTPALKTAETASSVAFVSGALTPYGGVVNPGFRVYELDDGTGEIWDWTEYYVNISDPSFKHGPQWQALYSAHLRSNAEESLISPYLHTQAQEKVFGMSQLLQGIAAKGNAETLEDLKKHPRAIP